MATMDLTVRAAIYFACIVSAVHAFVMVKTSISLGDRDSSKLLATTTQLQQHQPVDAEMNQVPSIPSKSLSNNIKSIATAAGVALLGQIFSTGLAVADDTIITRADVGMIDLNETEPIVTDVCWMDIVVGDNTEPKRVEISLYGTVAPRAVANFKSLCKNEMGWGYKGSDIFRVISEFSLQGGNVGQPYTALPSQLSKYGKAGNPNPAGSTAAALPIGEAFPADNFRVLHSYREAGVISMMRDITNKGLLDSRFFITFSPYASWADDKYEAFGRISKGMDLISAIQIVPVQPPSNYPLSRIRIIDSGCY